MHFIMRDLKKKFKMSDWTEKENLFFLHNIDLYWQYSYQLRNKFQESIDLLFWDFKCSKKLTI